jgi:hypothetical protein
VEFYEDRRVELYDLGSDPGEMTDLSSVRPVVADSLRLLLHEILDEMGANYPRFRNEYTNE